MRRGRFEATSAGIECPLVDFSCSASRGLGVTRGWEALAVSVALVAACGCAFAGETWVEEGVLAVEGRR